LVTGAVLTIITTFTFITREKVIDIGSLKITAMKPHDLTWSPFIGVGIMIAGGLILLVPTKNS